MKASAPEGASERVAASPDMRYVATMSEMQTQTDRDRRSGRFLSGCKPGPGRAKGSRNRLAEDFLAAMADDFSKHGVGVIEKVRTEKPDVYLRVAVDLLPKSAELDVDVTVLHEIGDTLAAYRRMAEMLGADPKVGLRQLRRRDAIDVEPA